MIKVLVASSMGSVAYAITGNPQLDTNRTNVGLVIFYSFDASEKLVNSRNIINWISEVS